MTLLRALILGAAVAFAGSPLLAQEAGDKVRLDDFAIGSKGEADTAMTQVGEAPALNQSETAEISRDVSVTRLSSPESSGPSLQQLVEPGHGTPDQVVRARRERSRTVATISSRSDSKPEPVTPIDGRDACDPQSDAARRDPQCKRILELRSGEFHAPEAPRLSAEQELLVQQELHRRGAANPRQPGGLLANSDDTATQELAATVLNREPAPPTPDPAEPALTDIVEMPQSLFSEASPPSAN